MAGEPQGCLVIATEGSGTVVHLNDTGVPLEEVAALLHEVQPYMVDAMFYAPPAVVWRSTSLRSLVASLIAIYVAGYKPGSAQRVWADKAMVLLAKGES